MITINNFSKSYGSKKAVDGLSLHINPGEIFGFIGHNGAGKTTTLKACVGILDFSDGEILIDGQPIREKPVECKKKLAYIPDNPELYGFMSCRRYLNFISDIFEIPKAERDEKIGRYAKLFDVEDILSNSIQSLSHGTKQKIAIISALIHDPKILVLDEPFVGLDPKATHTLKEIMRGICDGGGAIFFSTHVLDVAEKLCDRIAIIKNGKLVCEGSPADIMGNSSLESVFLELLAGDENA